MAELVGVFAASHGPVIQRDWDRLSAGTQAQLTAGFDELGRRINHSRPDVLVMISPDHWVNFFLNNLPSVCIGVGEGHDDPPEPFMRSFPYAGRLLGHPGFAQHLLESALQREFEPGISHRLTLDHGFCIPLWRAKLNALPAIVPIIVNDLEPPMISVRRCLQWGELLREAIESYREPLRIGILASGGLSHSIGESTMGDIDEPFDHRFLQLLKQGSNDEIAQVAGEALRHTGNGSQEVRNWLIAHAAAGGGFDLIRYDPIGEVYVGCAFASWQLAPPQRAAAA